MLRAREITKDYTGVPVLEGVSFSLPAGSKTGLIGRNGAGKTTLLRILTGQDDDWSGKVTLERAGSRVGYVSQHFPPFSGSAFDFLMEPTAAVRKRLEELELAMGNGDEKARNRAMEAWGELRAAYDASDGDETEDRARRLLFSLGLEPVADNGVNTLSGGERTALALCRAMLDRPELLILDEPGNHLDLWGLAWLEATIREYPGTVLVVSHNRYLLDRTVGRIIELERGRAREFSGNYSEWRVEKLRGAVAGEMAWKSDQKKIERLEALVKRFREIARTHPDPAWGRRLHSRVTQLGKARERAAERPETERRGPAFSFSSEASRARLALRIQDLTLGFGGRILLDSVSLVVETGERIGLVGPNGCGKTTLLRCVGDPLPGGETGNPAVWVGPSMKIGRCSQHGETLDPAKTVLQSCIDAGAANADGAWKSLSRLLFTRDSLEQTTGELSGGERVRLQLALADIAGANFLVLDEPTNHLDIASCEAVEDALADFPGTLILVSHDRLLLDRVVTRIIEIADAGFTEYDGNFSDFWFRRYGDSVRRLSGNSVDLKSLRKAEPPAAARGPDDGSAARRRGAVEARILALEGERGELEKRLVSARSAGDLPRARDLGNRLAALSARIEKLYDEWE